jgi:hypothetical protein
MNKKGVAESFLALASSGRVREAYDKYIHPDFRHHNIFRFQDDLIIEEWEASQQFLKTLRTPTESSRALTIGPFSL